MPRSIASWIVRTARSSSAPPHIQPPMAQVPRPIRDGARSVPGIETVSILVGSAMAYLQSMTIADLSKDPRIGHQKTWFHARKRACDIPRRSHDGLPRHGGI
jgi:hypothetical protein